MSKNTQLMEVKRLIGDYPVHDAREGFRFVVRPEDRKGAQRKDPYNCALARAAHRVTGFSAVAIYHTISYIPVDKDGDGKVDVIERFRNAPDTKTAVEGFDRTGEFRPGEYLFLPPSKSHTLAETRKWNKKHRRDVMQQKIKGIRVGNGESGRKAKVKKEKEQLPIVNGNHFLEVRNGTGQVHFVKSPRQIDRQPEIRE